MKRVHTNVFVVPHHTMKSGERVVYDVVAVYPFKNGVQPMKTIESDIKTLTQAKWRKLYWLVSCNNDLD